MTRATSGHIPLVLSTQWRYFLDKLLYDMRREVSDGRKATSTPSLPPKIKQPLQEKGPRHATSLSRFTTQRNRLLTGSKAQI